jgi:hypothetical protein
MSFINSQPESQQQLNLQIGINEVGLSGSAGSTKVYDPRLFVARNMRLTFADSGRPVIAAATHEVSHESQAVLPQGAKPVLMGLSQRRCLPSC